MRVKKQKRHRRTVRFFSACYGFREPYKVLCDGTFIHHLLLHGLLPADDALYRLFGAPALLFASRCVVAELRALGDSHADAFHAACQLRTARCDHEKRANAETCIESTIGESNPEHFFVATQDADLRRKLQQVPGVPFIYGLKNSLFIEQPSAQQRAIVKSTEEKRLHMSEPDYLTLHKKVPKHKLPSHVTDLPATEDDSVNKVATSDTKKNINTRQMLGMTDKPKFKRKKAKGPNPLSCKKKKTEASSIASNNQERTLNGATKRKRIRKPRKSHKDSNLIDSAG